MTLNADLGEGEPPARTRALLRLVDLANIACGGHAGDAVTMARTIRAALAEHVAVGAHPGLAGGDFGRTRSAISADEFQLLMLQQVGGFAAICRTEGAKLHHVKLHGALYHAVEQSPGLALVYAATMRSWFPKVAIIAFAAGRVIGEARRHGVPVLAEVFADRGYRADGSLIPRGKPGGVIANLREVAARVPALRGDTICVHADSPNAVRIARAVRSVLDVL
ncbi:MAG: LamB/YcsF family protein [Terrimicrobiaceae bacterium]|nr:LamB/YcsF family protein [Terrimicrobiaceae bacterium]